MEKVKYGNSSYDSSKSRYTTFKRPDNRYYRVSVPTSACQRSGGEDGYCIVHGSREFEGWVKETSKTLTKMYHREISINKLSNIKKYQGISHDNFSFRYDYIDGIVEIYNTSHHSAADYFGTLHNNLHNSFKFSKKFKKDLKKKLKEKHGVVNKMKIVKYKSSSEIRIKL